jgi:glycosyltransferase involved in cell wall biosynthesis
MRPDIVFVWQLNDVSISPVLAAQDQDIPTVFRLDDYWLANLKKNLCLDPDPLKRRFRAAIIGLRDFDCINFNHMLVVSHSVKMSYVDVGFLEQNIIVMPEGIPSDIILSAIDLPISMAKDSFRLVYVGRLEPEKGTHIAVKALAHLVGEMGISNIHLDIIGVGPGDYIEQLKNLIVELNLASHVEFVGFVEHNQVLLRFSDYDAVLIPSLWEEPLSGTIAEAMARGLPVIATDRGGNPEIISDTENGLLVPPDDPVKLAYAIKMLVENPALVKKLREQALNTVRENYIHERIVDRVEEYFQGILVSKNITI